MKLVAVIGLLGVLLGALGAHGTVHETVAANGRLEQWGTAVQYHQIHALGLLALTLAAPRGYRASKLAFLIGIALFSGSLYVLAWTGIKWLGAVTPLGGLAFMVGWALLALKPGDKSAAS
jgi:uncharacterized membrane protein YgdD (TMEM256/DUF423 family)